MTMEVLLLRLDAPLVAFGGSAIDNIGVVVSFPGRSLVTGLLANALGWEHGDTEKLERLQERLRFATRCDRPGEPFVDYQTVDLGQDHLGHGWTTSGRPEARAGASAKGTHIRYRHYRADSIHTVALTLEVPDERPTLNEIEAALQNPARPLFIGRKCCLPSGPLFAGRFQAGSPIDALQKAPRLPMTRTGVEPTSPLSACWDAEENADLGDPFETGRRLVSISDQRDWANQVHTGSRLVWCGSIESPEDTHEG
jgi:CRISPR system Cascade subunit CasD